MIDGDICVYRIACTTENEPVEIAYWRMDEMLKGIMWSTGADEYSLYLSDSTENNFRTKYYPEYKANRKDLKKPKHYDSLRMYLMEAWNASITPEQETDDDLGINQTNDTIICTIDKDLDQIPGKHYNFVKELIYDVTEEEAIKYFYKQVLMGDITENIKGIPKIGPVKADKILENAVGEDQLFEATAKAYIKKFEEEGLKHLLINGICLKIRRNEGEIWTFPQSMLSTYTLPQLTVPL